MFPEIVVREAGEVSRGSASTRPRATTGRQYPEMETTRSSVISRIA